MKRLEPHHWLAIAGCVCLIAFVIAGAAEGWQADAELRVARWTGLMWTTLVAGLALGVAALAVRIRRAS